MKQMKILLKLTILILAINSKVKSQVSEITFTNCQCSKHLGIMPEVTIQNVMNMLFIDNNDFDYIFKNKGYDINIEGYYLIATQIINLGEYPDCYYLIAKSENALNINWSGRGVYRNVYPFKDIETYLFEKDIDFSIKDGSKTYFFFWKDNFGAYKKIKLSIKRSYKEINTFSDIWIFAE
jgi:hypothetical protein